MGKGNDNKDRKIDKKWEKLFEELRILENIDKENQYFISAEQIKKYYEPRLMTKFDYKDSLPSIFVENKLSILPVTRGNYIIGRFRAYQDFNDERKTKIEKINFPEWIEGIDYKNIYSEANAINCAYISKIFNNILEDEEVYLTFNGRMSSGKFDFYINDISNNQFKISVDRAQCEVDAAFEGRDKILLLEAKNSIFKDFITRQLYYPYRLISNKVNKTVIPCYLTYSNNVFSFYIYDVEQDENYNSLKLKKIRKFMIDDFNITVDDVIKIIKTNRVLEEPLDIPFPQADTFENIIGIINKLYEEKEFISKEEITVDFGIVSRQADYYSNACAYLGLANRQLRKGTISISDKGRKIMEMRSTEKYLSLFKLILSHNVFNYAMKIYLNTLNVPSVSDIVAIMEKCNIKRVNNDTRGRRARTVRSWLNWILDVIAISES
ncbi:type II restriction enzyme [Clostridium sp. MT-14]|uniref:type II restriction enzyme n=1 Tax=Clostridium sp. MT-14 TaxID=3348360 RepID=UPI00156CA760|nr:conserved hypothetical protein [Clostridiaceae bacterium BL-3]